MNTNGLQNAFQLVRRRAAAVRLGSAAGWALLAAIGVLIVAIWLDLILILPASLRVLALGVAGLLALGVLLTSAIQLLFDVREAALARRLDRVARTGGQILTGLDLIAQRRQLTPVGAGLANMAIERASGLASSIPARQAVSARPARRSGMALLGSVLAIGLLAAIMPHLARTEFLRFADPHGDHPPFSRTTFDVTPGHTRIIYGRGFDVTATVKGPPVERLELVVGGAVPGEDEQMLPMFPEMDGVWRATLTQITAPATYHVRAQRVRTIRYRVDVITVPRIESVRLRIEPPAYTHQAVYEGALPGNGISGLPGTRVTLWAESNRPLAGGTASIEWAGKTAEPLTLSTTASGGRQVTGSFTINAVGKLRLRVKDPDGQLSNDEFAAAIHLLADQKPFVRLTQPESVSLATPTATLPVAVQAEDDFGISNVQLYRSLNDSRPLPASVPIPGSQPANVEEIVQLPLSEYGLRPGDTIKLFARVEDNDPAGAKGSESAISVVRIVSQEDFERMVRTREGLEVLMSKYAQADRRMEAMAEELEKLEQQLATQPADSELAAQTREQIRQLAEHMEQESKEIEETAKADLPYDLDKALKQRLGESAGRLRQAAQQAKEMSRQPGMKNAQACEKLKGLAGQCRGSRQAFQKEAMEPLDKLAKVYPLMEDQARFVILYQQQQSLAERLAAMKGMKGDERPELRTRFRDLEQEQQQIRSDLEELLDGIQSHLDQLPPDKEFDQLRKTASGFLEEFGKSGATDVQRQAESHMAALEGTPSQTSAQEAADIMNRFISRCQGMEGEGQACLKFSPSLGDAMAATAQQLLAEAGLGQGSKTGMGIGSGYSAQRSTLSNVGLYGRLPAVGSVSSAGGKDARRSLGGRGINAAARDRGNPLHALSETVRTSAAADTIVPPGYRDRVGQYFERLAEELNQRSQR